MRVAVLSLTRDRLDYTKHCFTRLKELAGVHYDHYVLDQGSTDGTVEWLKGRVKWIEALPANIGISKGLNRLLALTDGYDVIVKFDNDCEPLTRDILRDTAAFVMDNPDWLISPRIEGLNSTPGTTEVVDFPEHGRVLRKGQIGGIFLAVNAGLYERFKYDETNPVWGMDDVQISQGRNCGYLEHHVANHYLTTAGQHADMPDYWARKKAEGRPL